MVIDKTLADEVKTRILALAGWDCKAFMRFREILETDHPNDDLCAEVEKTLRDFNRILTYCFKE